MDVRVCVRNCVQPVTASAYNWTMTEEGRGTQSGPRTVRVRRPLGYSERARFFDLLAARPDEEPGTVVRQAAADLRRNPEALWRVLHALQVIEQCGREGRDLPRSQADFDQDFPDIPVRSRLTPHYLRAVRRDLERWRQAQRTAGAPPPAAKPPGPTDPPALARHHAALVSAAQNLAWNVSGIDWVRWADLFAWCRSAEGSWEREHVQSHIAYERNAPQRWMADPLSRQLRAHTGGRPVWAAYDNYVEAWQKLLDQTDLMVERVAPIAARLEVGAHGRRPATALLVADWYQIAGGVPDYHRRYNRDWLAAPRCDHLVPEGRRAELDATVQAFMQETEMQRLVGLFEHAWDLHRQVRAYLGAIALQEVRGPLLDCCPRPESEVEGRSLPDYWLFLEVASTATWSHLDAFFRDTWVECCGHLSSCEAGGARRMSAGLRASPLSLTGTTFTAPDLL